MWRLQWVCLILYEWSYPSSGVVGGLVPAPMLGVPSP